MNESRKPEQKDELAQMVMGVGLIAFSMVAGAILLHLHVMQILSR